MLDLTLLEGTPSLYISMSQLDLFQSVGNQPRGFDWPCASFCWVGALEICVLPSCPITELNFIWEEGVIPGWKDQVEASRHTFEIYVLPFIFIRFPVQFIKDTSRRTFPGQALSQSSNDMVESFCLFPLDSFFCGRKQKKL